MGFPSRNVFTNEQNRRQPFFGDNEKRRLLRLFALFMMYQALEIQKLVVRCNQYWNLLLREGCLLLNVSDEEWCYVSLRVHLVVDLARFVYCVLIMLRSKFDYFVISK